MGVRVFYKVLGLMAVGLVLSLELKAIVVSDDSDPTDSNKAPAYRDRRVPEDSIILKALQEGEREGEFTIPLLLNDWGRIFFYCSGQPKPVHFDGVNILESRGSIEFLLFAQPQTGVAFDYSNFQVIDEDSDLLFPTDLAEYAIDLPPQDAGGFLIARFQDEAGRERYFGALVQGSSRCGTYIGNSADGDLESGTDLSQVPSVQAQANGGCQRNSASIPSNPSPLAMLLMVILFVGLRRRDV